MADDLSNLFGLDSISGAQPAPAGGDPFSGLMGMGPQQAPAQQPYKTPTMIKLEAAEAKNRADQENLKGQLNPQIKPPNPQDEQNFVQQTWAQNRYNPEKAGAAGKATLFLTDLLRGFRNQPSLRESVEQAARQDYQKNFQDQVAMANAQRQAAALQMNDLRYQNTALHQQMQDENNQQAQRVKEYQTQVNLLKGQNWSRALSSDLNNLPKGFASQTIMNPLTGENEIYTGPSTMKLSDVSDIDPKKLSAVYGDNFDSKRPRSVQEVNEIRNSVAAYDRQQAQLQAQKDLETQRDNLRKEMQDKAEALQKQLQDARLQAAEQRAGEQGEWQFGGQDKDGKPVIFSRRTGEVRHADITKAPPAGSDEKLKNKVIDTDFKPASDAALRYNTMSQNLEDAVKNHDQQAMLSLLTNHIGMTLGAQKGGRITKDVINEAIASRPWLQGMESKFDSNGLLSGVTLTPPQMEQMVGLAQSKFRDQVISSRNAAKFRGYSGPDPGLTPNAATARRYLKASGGDTAKAKQLMLQDGWNGSK